MSRVYLGGKFDERVQIRGYMTELEKLNFVITHDWATYESKSEHPQADMAAKDVEGVKSADAVVLLMLDPEYAYRGTFSELGVALGTNKRIYIVCPDPKAKCRSNVFFHHPQVHVLASWEDVPRVLTPEKSA